jgi:hypothetical protein
LRRRWIYIDGEAVEVGPDYVPLTDRTSYQVMPDIQPFKDMTGKVIEGRRQWRDHVKALGGVECGVSDLKREVKREWKGDPTRKADIHKATSFVEFYQTHKRPVWEREAIIKSYKGER